MDARHGRMPSAPHRREQDDVSQIKARRQEDDGFADTHRSAFGMHLAECAERPAVTGIAPYLSRWAGRTGSPTS